MVKPANKVKGGLCVPKPRVEILILLKYRALLASIQVSFIHGCTLHRAQARPFIIVKWRFLRFFTPQGLSHKQTSILIHTLTKREFVVNQVSTCFNSKANHSCPYRGNPYGRKWGSTDGSEPHGKSSSFELNALLSVESKSYFPIMQSPTTAISRNKKLEWPNR